MGPAIPAVKSGLKAEGVSGNVCPLDGLGVYPVEEFSGLTVILYDDISCELPEECDADRAE